MLQDVEHQYERIALLRLKTLIERANLNPGSPTIVRNRGGIHLDAVHVSQFHEAVEEKSVPAADIQDRAPIPLGPEILKSPEYEALACPPPPVSLEQIAIGESVGPVH
jgi:hypothetical protein